jgi:nitrogen fixation protein NifZ
MLARDSDIIEIDGPPAFDYGEKVIARKNVRNDGTYPLREIGDELVHKGDIGYVTSIGTFLQQFYIYGVDFADRGVLVGMKGRELHSLDKGIIVKIILRKDRNGNLSAYVPKKDLEQDVIATEKETYWGGKITLANGWTLELPEMPPETTLPVTVDARKLEDE